MIEHVAGNLLEADAEAYVNTVGVMGKGIALQIREDPAAAAAAAVHAWSPRKRARFQTEHVTVAWKRLREQEWI